MARPSAWATRRQDLESEWRRLKLVSQVARGCRRLARDHRIFEPLDVVRDSILACSASLFTPSKEIAEADRPARCPLTRVHAPEVSAGDARTADRLEGPPKPARRVARRQPGPSPSAGLIATAGGKGKLADAAIELPPRAEEEGSRRLPPPDASKPRRARVADRKSAAKSSTVIEVEVQTLDDAAIPEDDQVGPGRVCQAQAAGTWVSHGRAAQDPGRLPEVDGRHPGFRPARRAGQEHARVEPTPIVRAVRFRTPIAPRSTPSPGPCSSAGNARKDRHPRTSGRWPRPACSARTSRP